MIQVYVASRFTNWRAVEALRTILVDEGYAVSSSWARLAGQPEGTIARDEAMTDVAEVREADVVVVIPATGVRGTLLEMGLAMGMGKPVIVMPGPLDHIFYEHPYWVHAADAEDLLRLLSWVISKPCPNCRRLQSWRTLEAGYHSPSCSYSQDAASRQSLPALPSDGGKTGRVGLYSVPQTSGL